jgi:hypothetical protein
MKLYYYLICIFSGKSLTPDGTAKLRNQIIDAPWVTPGQFTQAPSLDCIFSQCYSIKSWLDLRSDHVAIVHCSNGRSRSGILIACLLKYIGAFDHASQAFDFFCSARYELHTLSSDKVVVKTELFSVYVSFFQIFPNILVVIIYSESIH